MASVYEPMPVQRIVDNLSHIHDIYRASRASMERSATARDERLLFLRGLIDNLKHGTSEPSPRMLANLSRYTTLSLGGSFRLIGYLLDTMRKTEFALNGHRTRIVESYPFFRDREIDLPRSLSGSQVFERNAFVSEIISQWQSALPIRVLRGPDWQRDNIFYAQLGREDSVSLSGIPSGAFLSVEPATLREQAQPSSGTLYFLQSGNGYLCCRCAISRGKLILTPYRHVYEGPYEFLYPEQIRIVGKVRAFGVQLPAANTLLERTHIGPPAPLVLPWEQPSFSTLLRTHRLLFRLTKQDLNWANELFNSLLGSGLSSRTLRRYEHGTQAIPHTGLLLALTLFHAARISDVLRLLNLWQDEIHHHSLKRWLEVRSLDELNAGVQQAHSPDPRPRWESLLNDWGEWPVLLSLAIPEMKRLQHRLIRINQSAIFDGLDPLVGSGAVALLEESDELPRIGADRRLMGWERPIYTIRHGQDVLCGYLDNDGEHLALIPHPGSTALRLSFRRHHVAMVGKVIALTSPLRRPQ